jgi:hypothetical protein
MALLFKKAFSETNKKPLPFHAMRAKGQVTVLDYRTEGDASKPSRQTAAMHWGLHGVEGAAHLYAQ